MNIKPDEDYESVIKRPPTLKRPANRDGEVSAEDEQDFLSKCNALLAKGAPATAAVPAAGSAAGSAAGTPTGSPAVASHAPIGKTPSKSRLSTPPASGTPSPKKVRLTCAFSIKKQNHHNHIIIKKGRSVVKSHWHKNNETYLCQFIVIYFTILITSCF